MPEPLRPVMMTTSGSPVAATFLPACFLKAIPRPVVLFVRLRTRRAALRLCAAEHLRVSRGEPVGRIVTAQAQQVHAHRRLDERGETAVRVYLLRLRGYNAAQDRKSTRLNSSHSQISYAVFC